MSIQLIQRSEAQKTASRENGKASHGPVTVAGRRRSSQNAIQHGLRSARVVLSNESQQKYDTLLNLYFAEWNPIGQTERDLLVSMVNALWRKRRSQSTETGAINTEMFINKPDTDGAFPGLTPCMRQADAIISIANANPSANDYFLRAEARLDRSFRNARNDLIQMQTMRLGHPPTLNPQPEPNLAVLSAAPVAAPNTEEAAEINASVTYEPEAASHNFKEPETFALLLPFIPSTARPSPNRLSWLTPNDPRRSEKTA